MAAEKKKYTSIAQRVDTEICNMVRAHIKGQESIGGFYDRAALEKLEREGNPVLNQWPIKKETK